MPVDQRLQRNLEKLVAKDGKTSAAGRTIRSAKNGDLVLGILREIDETILPRNLTFENELGQKLAFGVASRRLLFLVSSSQEIDSPLVEELVGKPMADSSPDLIHQLAELLETFVAGSVKLGVQSDKPTDAAQSSDVGCLASFLAQSWAKTLYEVARADFSTHIESFISSCSPIALAWMTFDKTGGINEVEGEQGLAVLKDLLSSDLADLEKQVLEALGELQRIGCVILGSPSDQGNSIAYVFCPSIKGLMLVPTSHVPDLQKKWVHALNA